MLSSSVRGTCRAQHLPTNPSWVCAVPSRTHAWQTHFLFLFLMRVYSRDKVWMAQICLFLLFFFSLKIPTSLFQAPEVLSCFSSF